MGGFKISVQLSKKEAGSKEREFNVPSTDWMYLVTMEHCIVSTRGKERVQSKAKGVGASDIRIQGLGFIHDDDIQACQYSCRPKSKTVGEQTARENRHSGVHAFVHALYEVSDGKTSTSSKSLRQIYSSLSSFFYRCLGERSALSHTLLPVVEGFLFGSCLQLQRVFKTEDDIKPGFCGRVDAKNGVARLLLLAPKPRASLDGVTGIINANGLCKGSKGGTVSSGQSHVI